YRSLFALLYLFLLWSLAVCAVFFCVEVLSQIYTLSLHDALPISRCPSPGCSPSRWAIGWSWSPPSGGPRWTSSSWPTRTPWRRRSEEHTSELQSRFDLVCRLLLEKKQ